MTVGLLVNFALAYWALSLLVWFGLGFATEFKLPSHVAAGWAFGWPLIFTYQALRWVVTGPLCFLAVLVLMPVYLVFDKRDRRRQSSLIEQQKLVERCDQQHKRYIQGLMSGNESFYREGLYGDFGTVQFLDSKVPVDFDFWGKTESSIEGANR